MIELEEENYESWSDYFHSVFSKSGKYNLVDKGIMGDTNMENYIPLDSTNKTIIEVGYLHGDKLIYLNYFNQLTPGFTQMKKREYFYRFDFTPGKSYGNPGLEFIEINLQAIHKELMNGLKGKELQYFQNMKLIKSEIFLYYDGANTSYPLTIDFDGKTGWQKLFDLFFKAKTNWSQVKEVDLKTVFSGL